MVVLFSCAPSSPSGRSDNNASHRLCHLAVPPLAIRWSWGRNTHPIPSSAHQRKPHCPCGDRSVSFLRATWHHTLVCRYIADLNARTPSQRTGSPSVANRAQDLTVGVLHRPRNLDHHSMLPIVPSRARYQAIHDALCSYQLPFLAIVAASNCSA